MDTHIKKKMLHVKHLQKSFKDKTVLKEVTFDVTPGEVFVLLGSNGAGKTTLMKTLAALHGKRNGEITVCGIPIEKAKEMLAVDGLTLTEIAHKLNYSSVAHLSAQFKKVAGLPASHFKNLNKVRRITIQNL